MIIISLNFFQQIKYCDRKGYENLISESYIYVQLD